MGRKRERKRRETDKEGEGGWVAGRERGEWEMGRATVCVGGRGREFESGRLMDSEMISFVDHALAEFGARGSSKSDFIISHPSTLLS